MRPEDTATIVYTSGTTGEPKGCVITHANLLAEVDAAASALRELLRPEAGAPSPSTLLFLPLAHIFGRAVQVAAIQEGVRLGHASNVRTLTDDLAAFQPTFLLAVPRFLEKIHSTAREQAGRGVGAAVFDMAEAAAVDYGRALDGAGPGLWLRTRRRVFDRLVYRRLRGRLGGRLCYVVCGGGKLDIRLVHFYRGLGLEVLEGYGLTETTAAITVNVPGRVRAGTVGEPLPGVAVRVADDSEISARGPQVFKGYHGNDQKTREAMRDGWFATGDLGEITGGRLRITGRKKEIIVTAGGKNVEPQAIEEQIAAHPLVSRCLLVGDGRPFVAALVTIDTDALKRWKREHGKDPGADRADLAEDRDLRAAVQEAVDDANSGVARVESVRKFTVLPEDFTIEDQTLTPTLDLRRNRIQERYRDQIEAMYKTTD
ncbi:AMP-dependent synthetase/ligase [Allosalinactinospora lopnorensis]|uniref:AMP-dependent synthetase/ligase n=1 Tax=Allosalinactinospora lopnorensis TaxID=1352348 RepID=UPI000A803E13|nr:AMP-dependent synthetase/ligase [Allosalinactinospora lopnorensis]